MTPKRLAIAAAAACLLAPALTAAADEKRAMTREEIAAWLDARAVPSTRDTGEAEAPPEAPPPPPRRRGLLVAGSVGVLGHLGPLRRISAPGPWFHLIIGYEPFEVLTVLAEADVAYFDTSRAPPPPEARAYALFGFGVGARFTLRPNPRIGLYGEGTIGAASVTEDVLSSYGFRNANELNPYLGVRLGFEWYQINPHYALGGQFGLRSYAQGLDRQFSSETPLALQGGVTLRYTF